VIGNITKVLVRVTNGALALFLGFNVVAVIGRWIGALFHVTYSYQHQLIDQVGMGILALIVLGFGGLVTYAIGTGLAGKEM
jgi:hypothetical protein